MSELRIGQVVEIPYGNKVENGIIADIYRECPIDQIGEVYARIRPISQLITDTILLAPYQINMIIQIAKKYMLPIHRVLGIFLTRPTLSRLEKKNYEQLLQDIKPHHATLGNDQNHISIVQDGIVIPEIVERYITHVPSIVILPDDFAMMPYREYHKNRDDILFVSNDMTDVRRAQAWIDIANQKFPIIYGTRRLIHYNLEKYLTIIYVEDALGPDYWHYPIRIEYNDILSIFAAVNPNKNIRILTSVPRLKTLTHFRHFQIENITR